MKRAYPMTATLLAGLTLAAAGSHAAQDSPDKSSVGTAVARLTMPACESGALEAKRFVVSRADGGTRTMDICDDGAGGESAAMAKALSDAIDAERGNDKFYVHSRMPELLVLRVARARTQMDPSLADNERMRKLAAMNAEINALESEISKSAAAQ